MALAVAEDQRPDGGHCKEVCLVRMIDHPSPRLPGQGDTPTLVSTRTPTVLPKISFRTGFEAMAGGAHPLALYETSKSEGHGKDSYLSYLSPGDEKQKWRLLLPVFRVSFFAGSTIQSLLVPLPFPPGECTHFKQIDTSGN